MDLYPSGIACAAAVTGPKLVAAGETATEHTCHKCGRRSKWRRNVDERSPERQLAPGSVVYSENTTPEDLDPPLLEPQYRCPNCGHGHRSVSND